MNNVDQYNNPCSFLSRGFKIVPLHKGIISKQRGKLFVLYTEGSFDSSREGEHYRSSFNSQREEQNVLLFKEQFVWFFKGTIYLCLETKFFLISKVINFLHLNQNNSFMCNEQSRSFNKHTMFYFNYDLFFIKKEQKMNYSHEKMDN